jgi:hypothetical protein
MADRGNYGELDGFRFKRAASARTPDPATATRPGVPGDLLRSIRRAARELHANRSGKIRNEVLVLDRAPLGVALAAPLPHFTVDQAFLLGLRDRRGLGENALPFVALACATPLNDNRGEPTCASSPSSQGGIATRDELQMAEVSAVQAHRAAIVHGEEITPLEFPGARRTSPRLARRDYQ